MTDPLRCEDQLDQDATLVAAITRALEQPPQLRIPADFAAQVRASLPQQPLIRNRISAGRVAAFAAASLLLAGVFVIAPHTIPTFNNVAFDVELSLLTELAIVASWLALARKGSIL